MTIKEVAKICGVSPATVSNVINGKHKAGNETTRKILDVIKENDYHPNQIAQGLRRQSTRLVGLLAEDMTMFSTPLIIDGIVRFCEENGYNVILENMRLYARWQDSWFHNNQKYQSALQPAIRELMSLRVDGMIYIAGHERIVEGFDELPVPTVAAYTYTTNPTVPAVVIDDEKGGYEITNHLIRMGHRKIGVLAGEMDNLHAQARIRGYQKALFENGLLCDLDLIHYCAWNREAGYQAAGLFSDSGVTAVFCFSDQIAGGVYDYMHAHNMKVGKDISVAGYDDQVMAEYLYPSLTTMKLPLFDIGYHSAQKLIQLLSGEKPEEPDVEKLSCKMILRDSVSSLNIE